MKQAAIFDLDGVIVDTARFHYLAWKRLAAELGFQFTEAQNERLKGVSRMQSLEYLLDSGGLQNRFSQEEKEKMAARKNRWYGELIATLTEKDLLPGAECLLKELKAAGVAVVLGSASKNAPPILKSLGIQELFDAVVDGNMVQEAKPDPQVFTLGAELVGIPYEDCAVFEDSQAGIEAANRAGMYSIGVSRAGALQGCKEQIADLSLIGETSWYQKILLSSSEGDQNYKNRFYDKRKKGAASMRRAALLPHGKAILGKSAGRAGRLRMQRGRLLRSLVCP